MRSLQEVHVGTPHACRRAFLDDKSTYDTQACATHWWANLVFLNNQLPAGGCFNVTWSLAVQAQFYVLLPLALVLLRPQKPGFRCPACTPT